MQSSARLARPLISLAAALALVACFASPGSAAEPPVTFWIDRIVVEGIEPESAREIVIAESLLREGESYSERELREAVFRIRRLPFIVTADMALRRGNERGAYELVISVERVRPVAFGLDAGAGSFGSQALDFRWGGNAILGGRAFVGSSGVFFGSVESPLRREVRFIPPVVGEAPRPILNTQAQIGYTHYGLFRPGGYVTLTTATDLEALGDSAHALHWSSLELGLPLRGNHALRALLESDYVKDSFETVVQQLSAGPSGEPDILVGSWPVRVTSVLDGWSGSLRWIYDTTDDPLFPSKGLQLGATFRGNRHQHRGRMQALEDETGELPAGSLPSRASKGWGAGLDAQRFWAFTPRQSFGVGGVAQYLELSAPLRDPRHSALVSTLNVRHSVDLSSVRVRDEDGLPRVGDLRFETGLAWTGRRDTFGLQPGRRVTQEFMSVTLQSSLLLRNPWGVVRLSLTYGDAL